MAPPLEYTKFYETENQTIKRSENLNSNPLLLAYYLNSGYEQSMSAPMMEKSNVPLSTL